MKIATAVLMFIATVLLLPCRANGQTNPNLQQFTYSLPVGTSSQSFSDSSHVCALQELVGVFPDSSPDTSFGLFFTGGHFGISYTSGAGVTAVGETTVGCAPVSSFHQGGGGFHISQFGGGCVFAPPGSPCTVSSLATNGLCSVGRVINGPLAKGGDFTSAVFISPNNWKGMYGLASSDQNAFHTYEHICFGWNSQPTVYGPYSVNAQTHIVQLPDVATAFCALTSLTGGYGAEPPNLPIPGVDIYVQPSCGAGGFGCQYLLNRLGNTMVTANAYCVGY